VKDFCEFCAFLWLRFQHGQGLRTAGFDFDDLIIVIDENFELPEVIGPEDSLDIQSVQQLKLGNRYFQMRQPRLADLKGIDGAEVHVDIASCGKEGFLGSMRNP
jgi:hypothetical protein